MSRKPIEENVKRRLFAESMGRCMNPNGRKEFFESCGDIIEKAHRDPYSDTEDNSFENLVLLCPNCHTNFIVTEIMKSKRKGRKPMNKNAIDVLNVTTSIINNLSGNLAGGALLANVLYVN